MTSREAAPIIAFAVLAVVMVLGFAAGEEAASQRRLTAAERTLAESRERLAYTCGRLVGIVSTGEKLGLSTMPPVTDACIELSARFSE